MVQENYMYFTHYMYIEYQTSFFLFTGASKLLFRRVSKFVNAFISKLTGNYAPIILNDDNYNST